jgi:hypothetical protein
MLKPLHEGTSFLISNDLGNVQSNANEQSGLFYEDSRFLSFYQLKLNGSIPIFLSSEEISESERRFFLSNGLISQGSLEDPPFQSIKSTESLRTGGTRPNFFSSQLLYTANVPFTLVESLIGRAVLPSFIWSSKKTNAGSWMSTPK